MNQGYCPSCQKYSNTSELCDSCGGKLIFFQASSNMKNFAYNTGSQNISGQNVKYSQQLNNNQNPQTEKSKFAFVFKNMDKLTKIGILLLSLYNIIGIFMSQYAAQIIIKEKRVFLVKINVSYFWMWLLVIINFLFLIGTILLRKNKSVICTVGQGAMWLFTLFLTSFINKNNIDYENMERAWKNGIVVTYNMSTGVSKLLGVSAFSIGHLFVIVLWIAALICVALGRTREF